MFESVSADAEQREREKTRQAYKAHATGAQREKLKGLDFSLIPYEALEAYARVLKYGATKYAPGNWEKGLPNTQLMASLIRHTWAYMRGEDYDQESHLPHTDHIVFNACALAFNFARFGVRVKSPTNEPFEHPVDDRRIHEYFMGKHPEATISADQVVYGNLDDLVRPKPGSAIDKLRKGEL